MILVKVLTFGVEVVSLTLRPAFTPKNIPDTRFYQAWPTPAPQCGWRDCLLGSPKTSSEADPHDHAACSTVPQLRYRMPRFKPCKSKDGPPLWSSGHSSRLKIRRSPIRFPELQKK
jgi:hypothetical protein